MQFYKLSPFFDGSTVEFGRLNTLVNGRTAYIVRSNPWMVENGFNKYFVITARVKDDNYYNHENTMWRRINQALRCTINDHYLSDHSNGKVEI